MTLPCLTLNSCLSKCTSAIGFVCLGKNMILEKCEQPQSSMKSFTISRRPSPKALSCSSLPKKPAPKSVKTKTDFRTGSFIKPSGAECVVEPCTNGSNVIYGLQVACALIIWCFRKDKSSHKMAFSKSGMNEDRLSHLTRMQVDNA